MYTSDAMALMVLHEFKIAEVFSKLMKKYFLSSNSPLQIANLV